MLPDLLAPDLKLIFCGTAASHKSAARGHYYAGPGNRFWPLLFETGLTPRRFFPTDDGLLLTLGIGLTDLAKGVSGMDRDIPAQAYAPARLKTLIAELRPQRLAFTSLTAAKIALGSRYGAGRILSPAFAGLPIWVLPSPSGAARGTFSSQPWHDLANDFRGDT
ncbi:mismatch-specific DNA-glycosylase [Pseudorhodobacter sp. W20_MBD10_FR17]|uniref:mismatch-specific DNA-glycosylase n=1 Tax=Pseudorhodobacter sp. W20_MBD10_FR17 TaxID=3240266 RepID=UPI003F9B0F17